jgi:hypothetical protein
MTSPNVGLSMDGGRVPTTDLRTPQIADVLAMNRG